MHHKHALQLLLAGIIRTGRCRRLHVVLLVSVVLQVFGLTDGQRLQGNGQHVRAGCRSDLGGAGEARPQVLRWIAEGDYNLEILGFLAAGRAL